MKAQMLNNLESVGELVGALKGMEEGLEEDAYMESIIQRAHGEAATVFDAAAASAGMAGHLKHVFEYGVSGVTRGPVRFPDPTAPEARLWTHTLKGVGGHQDVGYSFRPAVIRNPKPTTASTGVPSKYLRRLSNRKYVFWNKAFVMETGMSVTIKSQQPHGMLFIPTPGQNAPKNFVLWNTHTLGPIQSTPGKSSRGEFTAFWMNWWGGPGGELMEHSMRKSVTIDIEKAMAAAAKNAQATPMKPAHANNIMGAAVRARTFVKKLFGRKASRAGLSI